jgi:hypothetical protein
MRYPSGAYDDPDQEYVLVDASTFTPRGGSVKSYSYDNGRGPMQDGPDALSILLPFLFVLSTILFVMILFLVCILLLRRRRGISLRDSDGPVDVSRDDVFNDADGGLAGIEERWLETLSDEAKRNYRQAKSMFICSDSPALRVLACYRCCFWKRG